MIPNKSGEKIISNFCISTALGTGGSGIFPRTLLPAYRLLLDVVKETETTVLAKSATRHKRVGNFIPWNPLTWKYIQNIPWSDTGMLNAYGLTNAGVDVIAPKIRVAIQNDYDVIPNFFPEFAKGKDMAIRETLMAIAIYKKILGANFQALEINYSCPNSEECVTDFMSERTECTRQIKKCFQNLFLIIKVGYDHSPEFCQEQEKAGADGLHGINTIRWSVIYGHTSPLENVGGGGVSGGSAKLRAYEYNKSLRKKVSIPLIFGCGVENLDDYKRYVDAGADSVSACSLALRQPRKAAEIAARVNC
jgi:dihydroorotate dehydrogenase